MTRNSQRSILLLGLGNDILRDDGVGIYVARQIAQKLPQDLQINVKETTLSGLNLLELIKGYDVLYLIDAVLCSNLETGELVVWDNWEDSFFSLRTGYVHDVDFFSVLELGKSAGFDMPEVGAIFVINVKDPYTLDTRCSPEIEEKIPHYAEEILAYIKRT